MSNVLTKKQQYDGPDLAFFSTSRTRMAHEALLLKEVGE